MRHPGLLSICRVFFRRFREDLRFRPRCMRGRAEDAGVAIPTWNRSGLSVSRESGDRRVNGLRAIEGQKG